MTKKNIQYSLAGSGRTTALWAQGRCGFDDVVGSGTPWGRWRRKLREDDSAAGLEMARVDGVASLGTAWGAQCRGIGEDNIVAC
jgi:hypothetical protein